MVMSNAAKMWFFVFTFGFVFNFVETWYFGWNWKPASPAEVQCDYVTLALVLSGLIGGWISK